MPTIGPTRTDTYRVNVSIEHPANGNMLNYGIFDKLTGGEVDSEEAVYRPGNMGARESLGGSVTYSNVIVSRLYKLDRDHSVIAQIRNSVGKCSMIISKTPLNIHGESEGISPVTYRGTLKRLALPEHDSMATDPGLFELEMTVESIT